MLLEIRNDYDLVKLEKEWGFERIEDNFYKGGYHYYHRLDNDNNEQVGNMYIYSNRECEVIVFDEIYSEPPQIIIDMVTEKVLVKRNKGNLKN